MKLIEQIRGIGLGTAQFAFKHGSREQSIATVIAAMTAGVELIDTALAYNRAGETSFAESVVHDALQRQGSEHGVIVATKGGHWRRGDDFPIDGSAAVLRAHCEISLRMLGVDRLDLYQLHHVDPDVPLEDSVGALAELQDEGKIHQIGLSNVSIEQIESALGVARISSIQNRLSFSHPEDLATAERCSELGIRYLAYLPLDGPDASIASSDSRAAIAHARGVSVQALTLAWLRLLTPSVVPLVGSSRPETIVDSAGSVDLELTVAEVDEITRAAQAEALTI